MLASRAAGPVLGATDLVWPAGWRGGTGVLGALGWRESQLLSGDVRWPGGWLGDRSPEEGWWTELFTVHALGNAGEPLSRQLP